MSKAATGIKSEDACQVWQNRRLQPGRQLLTAVNKAKKQQPVFNALALQRN